MTVRVLIADDQEMVRTGLKLLCEHDGDIEVVGQAADGDAAVSQARRLRPDVVLMDIRMPVRDGLAATRDLLAAPGTHPRVLVLTTYELDRYVFEALRAGASGFLAKDVSPAGLREAIRTVAAGRSLLSPAATRAVVEAYLAQPPHRPDPARLAPLTVREREVLALVGRGMSNLDISRRLFLSPATVKTHVNRAQAKLGAHDRAQLVVIAYETGLVRPGGVA